MAEYRRFISYIYAYEGDMKTKNVGFAKIEARNGQCRISISIKGAYECSGQELALYGYGYQGADCLLIPLGRLPVKNGTGEAVFGKQEDNLGGSGYSLGFVKGLYLRNGTFAQKVYLTTWDDTVIHVTTLRNAEIAGERQTQTLQAAELTTESRAKPILEDREQETQKTEGVQPEIQWQKPKLVKPEFFSPDFVKPTLPEPEDTGEPMLNPGFLNFQEQSSPEREIPGTEASGKEPPKQETSRGEISEKEFQEQKNLKQEVPRHVRIEREFREQGFQKQKFREEGFQEQKLREEKFREEGFQEQKLREEKFREEGFGEEGFRGQKVSDKIGSPEIPKRKGLKLEIPEQERRESAVERGAAETAAASETTSGHMPEEFYFREGFTELPLWECLRRILPRKRILAEAGWEVLQIHIQDIGRLPRENWPYGNNSFVLHGYFQYRYLILARRQKQPVERFRSGYQYILGVPGIFKPQEKFMASMFGLPEFKRAAGNRKEDFGFWCGGIQM